MNRRISSSLAVAVFLFVAEVPADDVSLAAAMTKTAQGDLEGAESIYRQLGASQPEIGLPAWARFVALTRSEGDVEAFLAEHASSDELPLTLRTQIWLQAGKIDSALAYLRETGVSAIRDQQWEAVQFAAATFLLEGARKEGIELLAQGILADSDGLAAKGLMEDLLELADALLLAPQPVLAAFAHSMKGDVLSGEDWLGAMDAMIRGAADSGRYWQLRETWLASLPEERAFRSLFTSILYFHEGRLQKAESSLLQVEIAKPHVVVHQIRLLAALGRSEESARLAATFLHQQGQEPTSVQRWLAADAAIKSGSWAQARSWIDTVSFNELSEDLRVPFLRGSLRLAVGEGDHAALVSALAAFTSETNFETLRRTLKTLAPEMAVSGWVEAMREQAEMRDLRPEEWLLFAELEKTRGDPSRERIAKRQFVTVVPDDFMGLSEWVNLAFQETNLETEADLRFAESQAEAMIRAQPFAPEPMRLLMNLYRKTGRPEQAPLVPDIVGLDATNPKILSQCGYVLATEGFPERALEYYERALAIEPRNQQILMNRASCFTRLGRWDEAREYYRSCLEGRAGERPFHIHECLLRLWAIAEQQETEGKCVTYLDRLIARAESPWKDRLAAELVALMVRVRRLEDAVRFQEATRNEDSVINGVRLLARGFVEAGLPDRAEQLLREAAMMHPSLRSTFEQSLASLEVEQGKTGAAMARLQRLASNPDDPGAADALFYAASLADRNGKRAEAGVLYQQFLDSASVNFELRQKAGSRLAMGNES